MNRGRGTEADHGARLDVRTTPFSKRRMTPSVVRNCLGEKARIPAQRATREASCSRIVGAEPTFLRDTNTTSTSSFQIAKAEFTDALTV